MNINIINKVSNTTRIEEGKTILNELLQVVKECQTRYGGKSELATETDSRILRLCYLWEQFLSYGIKSNSVLKNVHDIVSGTTIEQPTFWTFAYGHLTAHERERFSTLRHVWTDRGKIRALIRSALNERALERYILIWLNDPNLPQYFESWSLIQNPEACNLLPSIASGLNSILFAITVDSTDLNVQTQSTVRPEPIIAVRAPIVISSNRQRRQKKIINFDEGTGEQSSSTSPTSSVGSAPKSLATMCLKYDGKKDEHRIERQQIEILSPQPDRIVESSIPVEIYNIPTELPVQMTINHSNGSNDLDIDDVLTPQSDSGITETFEIHSPSTTPSSSKISSLPSSMGSVKSNNDVLVAALRDRIRDTEERCSMLEARIAELSLENHRLKGLHGTSNRINYFTISIPRAIVQRSGTRTFHNYIVHVLSIDGNEEWTLLRRYNDFYKLHKKYQKDNQSVKTLDFPPKKKFGNMDANFVEQRRQRLQIYLRHLLNLLPETSSCTTRTQLEQMFPFFSQQFK